MVTSVTKTPWKDISMDFVMGLPRSSRNKDSVIVVAVYFFKIVHFIPYSKTLDVITITDLYLRRLLDFMIFQKQQLQIEIPSS
jgi:hypothetical protein